MSTAASLERPLRRTSRGLAAAIVTWMVAVVGTMSWLSAYKATPGAAGAPPASWPAGSAIPRVAGRPTLVLFALPVCPCTRATLEELRRLLPRTSGADVHVMFVMPDGADPTWREDGAWALARAIPGAAVHEDAGGREARRFDARTSGVALFFGSDGTLRFRGGITGSRGHEGDNAGADAITRLLAGDRPRIASTPVFGCPLETPDSR